MKRPALATAGALLLGLSYQIGGAAAFLQPPPVVASPCRCCRSPAATAAAAIAAIAPVRRRHLGPAPLKAQRGQDDGGDVPFFEQRGMLRPLFTGLVWLGFVLYAIDFAPGAGEAARNADQKLLTDLIANPLAESVTPLFAMIFNMLGILPFIYTSLLLPGARDQKPVPAAPFCIGSFALGFFALGPYLAVREFRPDAAPPQAGWLRKAIENKIPAVLAMVGALVLVKHGFFTGGAPELDLAGRIAEYRALFETQMLPHVSSLDFLILNLFVADAMREDMMRRDWYSSAKVLGFSLVPVLGPCLYLILRPALPDLEEAAEEA